MSSFTTPLIISPVEDGRKYRLVERFVFISKTAVPNVDVYLAVPVGFTTDFASVPRALWCLLPPHGQYGKAAVLHDYLCTAQDYRSRVSAEVFNEAMQVLKVTPWKRKSMYWAVRLFGPRF